MQDLQRNLGSMELEIGTVLSKEGKVCLLRLASRQYLGIHIRHPQGSRPSLEY